MTDGSESKIARKSQAAVRRLFALSLMLVAVVLVGVAGLLAEGSRRLDDLKVKEDQFLIANAIDRIGARVVSDMTTVTVWDQAYRNMRPGGDIKWADAEIGSFYANNRGFDRTVAIDPQNRPFYAWVGKQRADPVGQARFVADVAPLIQRLRDVEAKGDRYRPNADPNLAVTAKGIVVSGGKRYFVGATLVTPSDARPAQSSGPGVMVLTAQALDPRVISSLHRMQVDAPRIVDASNAAASSLLVDIRGQRVGAIVWKPQNKGLAALRAAAPALSLGLVIFAVVMGVLAWQMWRVVRELDAYELAHEDAVHDLEEARDRAESANIAKSQFLANMSHEIRTPLNGILGMAQVLAAGGLPPEVREKVRVIRSSGETLLTLLNDVLDLSKIEAGRMEMDVTTFELGKVVAGAMRAFADAAEAKDVAFAVDVAPNLSGVWQGDAGKVRQVLGNLASNAVKFTDAGEVRLTVCRIKAGVSFCIADTGMGIAGPQLANLFRRFSQVDPTATRKFGGTGLGLAICRELVELMGGMISVSSVVGRGSTFTVELPLAWIGAAPQDEAEPDVEFEAELPPLRILAAEDNKTNQLLLNAMLDPMGVDLRMASDGREALEAFQEGGFDLVLMDIQMPIMNGIDATLAIRAFEQAKNRRPTPILALSANAMTHQVEEYLAAGMNSFVSKPIDMATLIGAIETALVEGGDDPYDNGPRGRYDSGHAARPAIAAP